MPIQKFYVASAASYKPYSQTFKSSGTWTCPVGVNSLDVYAVGGGGGGGGLYISSTTTYASSGGGGGGEIVKKTVSVTPGTTYNVFVGAGGAGGYQTYPGQMGGYSAFNPSYTTINSIIKQPYGAYSYHRYISNRSGYSFTSPPPYSDSSWTYTTPTSYNGSTGSPAKNTALTNNNFELMFYLGDVSSTSNYSGTYFWVPVKPNTQYTASGYFGLSSSGTHTGNVRIEFYSSLWGSQLDAVNGSNISFTSSWVRGSATGTSPSGSTYAMIRYAHNGSTGNTGYVMGMQMEEGSLTAFKSAARSSSGKISQPFGLIDESDSSAIAGGGGGGIGWTNSSSNWETYSSYTDQRSEYYAGFGGGGAVAAGAGKFAGGNGANYRGEVSEHKFWVNNYASTDTGYNVYSTIPYAPGLPSGGAGVQASSSALYLFPEPPAPGNEDGFGAGGSGGRYNHYSYVKPSNTTLDAGGAANTGAGGSGTSVQGSSSYLYQRAGGTGGSGIVILKWMGQ